MPRSWTTTFIVAVTLASGLAGAPAARAASCEIPAAVRAAATPNAASGIIEVAGAAATPTSLPIATPISADTTALDPMVVLTDELLRVSQSLAACLSEGNAEMVTELAGERYLGQLFGSSVPLSAEDYLAIAADLTPVPTRILRIEEVAQPAEERATAIITQAVGNQLMRAEWSFEQAPRGERSARQSAWKLSAERQLPAETPRSATSIEVAIGEDSFTLDPATVQGPDVVLRGNNAASVDHEMLVLKLENGFTTANLLRATGPDLPEDAVFIGEVPVRAGREMDLVLVDLEPGSYTLVCLFPNAEGLPYLADGMEAVFTVE